MLDEIAATGPRFERFFAAHPGCSPTRGRYLPGRHPNRYGTFSPGWIHAAVNHFLLILSRRRHFGLPADMGPLPP